MAASVDSNESAVVQNNGPVMDENENKSNTLIDGSADDMEGDVEKCAVSSCKESTSNNTGETTRILPKKSGCENAETESMEKGAGENSALKCDAGGGGEKVVFEEKGAGEQATNSQKNIDDGRRPQIKSDEKGGGENPSLCIATKEFGGGEKSSRLVGGLSSLSLKAKDVAGEKPVLEVLTFGANEEGRGEAGEEGPVAEELPCLQCAYVSDSKEDILAHLLLSHKFIVADVNFVANLSEYFNYWKKRLTEKPITEFCSKIVTNTGCNDIGSKEEFYLLCDALPEDKRIRESLQQKKLEVVLSQQQKERDETKFCRQCLFCKQTFCGNRAVLFDHLLRDHTFHMGQPDNLVFTNELFDLIQFKLDSQLCLFCEKSFKDKASLREHMRKKQHRKINPKNKEYDRFYIINYMEMGKNWESLQSEDNRLVKGVERPDDEEEEWSGWTEASESGVVCLFCDFSCLLQLDLQYHMKDNHGFDLMGVNQTFQLNFYQKVKLINYIRRQVYHKTCYGCQETFEGKDELLNHFHQYSDHTQQIPTFNVWDQPQYFFPTYEDDKLLCHLDDDDDMAAGDALGVTVIAEDLPIKDSILLKDHKLCRDLQKA